MNLKINNPKILVIAPVFKDDLFLELSSTCDVDYYDEETLLKFSKFWKIGQAICYLMDIFLPRSLALSGNFRKLRVNHDSAKKLYTSLNEKCDSYDKVFFIKAFGAREHFFSKSNQKKLNLLLWDSIARYNVFKDMRKYIVATTSYYDSKKLNVPVLVFTNKNKLTTKDLDFDINKPKIFIGRFTLIRFFKSVALSLKVKNFKSYMGFSPFNVNFSFMKMRKSRITTSQNDVNEVLITDLNEDSPSARIDNENLTFAISDLRHLKDLFPHKNIYRISYFSGRLYQSINIDNIHLLTLKQLIR